MNKYEVMYMNDAGLVTSIFVQANDIVHAVEVAASTDRGVSKEKVLSLQLVIQAGGLS